MSWVLGGLFMALVFIGGLYCGWRFAYRDLLREVKRVEEKIDADHRRTGQD